MPLYVVSLYGRSGDLRFNSKVEALKAIGKHIGTARSTGKKAQPGQNAISQITLNVYDYW